jgi:hypothetical protein
LTVPVAMLRAPVYCFPRKPASLLEGRSTVNIFT